MKQKFRYGRFFQRARRAVGLKFEELASKTGLPVASLRGFESGDLLPSDAASDKIAKALVFDKSILRLAYQ